jgi:hypothetical protein
MRARLLVTSGVVAAMVLAAAVLKPVLVAQAPSGTMPFDPTKTDPEAAIRAAGEAAKAAGAVKDWTPPRTPWGDPDLRGYWLQATYTPLERPPELADKPFYTEEEAIAAFRKAVEADAGQEASTVHYDWKEYGMDAWQTGARPNLRTSLIVDPENGRLPPLTPEAQKRRAGEAAAARLRNPAVSVQTYGNLYTRCIVGLAPVPLVRGGNPGSTEAAQAALVSAESHLVQAPGYVVIVTQSNSEVRIIPLDGRPHLPDHVRQWLGDSRGRWEGDTLIVETTNFSDRSPAANFQGSTDALHLVERFTRLGPNTLGYAYTVTDPGTWTQPWSIEVSLPRVDPPLYEFACHEQNYGLINLVRGAQVREAEEGRGSSQ